MKKRNICLFTAHSPQIGGGGVILRSLIAGLQDVSVSWYYISNSAAPGYENGYLGPALMGGSFVNDAWNTWKMLTAQKTQLIDELVKKMLAIECDAYWIVSHNEGLRVAYELARSQTSRPVHLTVHDDWAGALCARSLRYRFMTGPAKQLTVKTLKAVSSFDVISLGMRNYYEKISGLKGQICHRYLRKDSIRHEYDPAGNSADELTVGHIGSIYDRKDLLSFLSVLVEFAEGKGKKALLLMWGCHLKAADIPAHLQGNIKFCPTLPEEKVLPELARCEFVYAMYPMSKALSGFSNTSLPTKLTSYVQAGRPVFGHCPDESTLAEFLKTTGLGVLWDTGNRESGLRALADIFTMAPDGKQFEKARQQYFGEATLEVMNGVFRN